MRISLSHALLVSSCALFGVAAGDPAPITYAGQGPSETMRTASIEENRLAGGADNSYGYGRERARSGAVIDLRRPVAQQRQGAAGAAAPSPVQLGAAPASSVQARPAWLEEERVGPPYQAEGRWYVPTAEPGYEQVGEASWYGPTFHGRATASGETYDQEAMTGAHPTLPLNSLVQVTNLANGREVIVRINDRGPYARERLIDLSRAAAQVLGFQDAGRARVHVRYLGPAPRRVSAAGAALAPTAAPAPTFAATVPLAYAPAPAPTLAPTPAPTPAPAPSPAPAPVQMGVEEGPLALTLPAASEAAAPAPTLQQTVYAPPARADYAPPPAGTFVVQVGAYADLENAHRVRGLVEQAGPVNVDVRQTPRGELFRVRVGPWASRAEAEAAQHTLARMGYPEAVIAAR